jgi:hypothetical protein
MNCSHQVYRPTVVRSGKHNDCIHEGCVHGQWKHEAQGWCCDMLTDRVCSRTCMHYHSATGSGGEGGQTSLYHSHFAASKSSCRSGSAAAGSPVFSRIPPPPPPSYPLPWSPDPIPPPAPPNSLCKKPPPPPPTAPCAALLATDCCCCLLLV